MIQSKQSQNHTGFYSSTIETDNRTLIKVYGAVSDEQITQLNNIKNLAIKQKNPTRVPRYFTVIQ